MCRICLCFYPAVCMRGHGDRQCINSLLPCLFLVVMGSFFFKWDFLFNKLWDITATSQTADCITLMETLREGRVHLQWE